MRDGELDARSRRAGVSRKQFLGTAAITSGAAFLAACGTGSSDGTTSAVAAGGGGNLPDGAPRDLTIVWALAAIGSWNIALDVGFNDAARLVGWKYKKVGLPVSQYSPENVVKVINQAIQTRPDVLVTPAWVPGVYDAVAEGRDKGITVMLNNANNNPEKADELGLTFIGGDGKDEGLDLGRVLLQQVVDGGKQSGVVLAGNTFPGNKNIEDRLDGLKAAIDQFNDERGTSFEYEEFVDAAPDAAKGTALYKAKMTQIGPDLVAVAGMGSNIAINQKQALLQQGKRAGDIPVGAWVTDEPMVPLLRDGWITANVDNNFYAEGFLPVMLAWQQKARGLAPTPTYSSGYTIVTKDDLQDAIDRQRQISSLAKTYGVKL